MRVKPFLNVHDIQVHLSPKIPVIWNLSSKQCCCKMSCSCSETAIPEHLNLSTLSTLKYTTHQISCISNCVYFKLCVFQTVCISNCVFQTVCISNCVYFKLCVFQTVCISKCILSKCVFYIVYFKQVCISNCVYFKLCILSKCVFQNVF